MCKIGLDLDEILTDIKQNSLTIRGGYRQLRQSISKLTRQLRENNDEIFIFTKWKYGLLDNRFGRQMRLLFEMQLRNSEIQYDEVVFYQDERADEVQKYNIEILIENLRTDLRKIRDMEEVILNRRMNPIKPISGISSIDQEGKNILALRS